MKINTKLEALKLIYDPCKLFSLLYSKYGNIDEDLFLYFSNQLLYNKNSHFNILFKEIEYENKFQENFKKFYKYSETILRLPKLSDYYKNYHLFFCKPNINNFKFLKILRNYEDNKAEIFYKENYSDSTISSTEKNKKIEKIEIFDKKTRKIIEDQKNNKKSENIFKLNNIKNNVNNKIQENINNSTLTLDSLNSYKNAIVNNFNNDFSFYDSVKNLINYKDKKESNLQKFKTNRSRVKKSSSTSNISNKNTNSINSVYKTYAISKNKEKKIFLSPKNNKNSFNLKHSMDNINIEKISKIKIDNLKRTINSNINNFNKLSNNLKIKSNIKKFKNKTEEINSFSNTKNISNNLKNFYFVSKFSIMKNSLKKLMNNKNNYSLKNLNKKNTSNTNRSKQILLTPSISLPKFSINNSNKQISTLINKSNINNNKNISSKKTLKESRNEKRIKNEISNNNSTKKKKYVKKL